MSSKIFSLFVLMSLFIMAGSDAAAQHTYVFGTERGHLGVSLEDITPRLKERKHLSVDDGAYVNDVVEDSPAEKAGIQEGDVIVKFNDRTIEDSDDLMRAVEKTKAKSDVKIEIVRNKDRKTLTATLERSRAPRSWSWNFGGGHTPMSPKMPRMPKLPQMPRHFGMLSGDHFGGLTVQELTRQLAEYFQVPDRHGLLVTEVEKESDGDKAGFKAGDVITKIGSVSIRDIDDMRSELEDSEGKDVAVGVLRNGKPVPLTLHLEAEDDDDDYSYHSLPDSRIHRESSIGGSGFGLKQRVLDRVMESLKNLQSRIESRIHSTINRIIVNLLPATNWNSTMFEGRS